MKGADHSEVYLPRRARTIFGLLSRKLSKMDPSPRMLFIKPSSDFLSSGFRLHISLAI